MDTQPTYGGDFRSPEIIPLTTRGITQETCNKYGYGVAQFPLYGTAQVANYYRKGKLVAQHLRTPDKQFPWVGNQAGVELFGQHLWEEGGKQLIITEGEIDCLTWAQARQLRWPVVGVAGVGNIKHIKQNLEWVSSFESVILYFDNDEPGRLFAEQVAELLPPGRVRIGSTHPHKDANDMFKAEGSKGLLDSLWNAKTWRPPELSSARDVLAERPAEVALKYPYESLNEKLGGIRSQELALICAGTNVGKSFVAKNLAFHYLSQGKKVGFIALEESSRSVLEMLIGFHHGLTQAQVENGNVSALLDDCPWADDITFYTDRGEDLAKTLLPRIRYMANGQDCDVIFIDHVSAVFARFDGDQRKQIDEFMYSLQSLCKEVSVPVFAVCHLRDPQTGASHNDGARPQLSELNGSSSLSRVPDTVLGVRRDVNNPNKRHLTELMILKSRFRGMVVGDSIHLAVENVLLQPTEIDDDEYFGDGGASDF